MNAQIRKRKRRGRGRSVRPTFSARPDSSLRFGLEGNRDGKREEIDESLRILRVVALHAEARQTRAIERKRRFARRYAHIAFEKRKPHGTGDALLRVRKERVQRFAQRSE